MRFISQWAGSLFVLCLWGCGESSERVAFSGEVTHSGQPITGTITFTPQINGSVATTGIAGGEYTFGSENGPIPGRYDVMIETAPVDGQKGAGAALVLPQVWKEVRVISETGEVEAKFELANPETSR